MKNFTYTLFTMAMLAFAAVMAFNTVLINDQVDVQKGLLLAATAKETPTSPLKGSEATTSISRPGDMPMYPALYGRADDPNAIFVENFAEIATESGQPLLSQAMLDGRIAACHAGYNLIEVSNRGTFSTPMQEHLVLLPACNTAKAKAFMLSAELKGHIAPLAAAIGSKTRQLANSLSFEALARAVKL